METNRLILHYDSDEIPGTACDLSGIEDVKLTFKGLYMPRVPKKKVTIITGSDAWVDHKFDTIAANLIRNAVSAMCKLDGESTVLDYADLAAAAITYNMDQNSVTNEELNETIAILSTIIRMCAKMAGVDGEWIYDESLPLGPTNLKG